MAVRILGSSRTNPIVIMVSDYRFALHGAAPSRASKASINAVGCRGAWSAHKLADARRTYGHERDAYRRLLQTVKSNKGTFRMGEVS